MRLGLKLFFVCLMMSTALHAQYIPKFDLQGHRGARGLKPENSIPSFLTALEWGVTTIELDVVITKDKQVVVSHEPWISAAICTMNNGDSVKRADELTKWNIYKLTYAEVKGFDCGSKFNPLFPEQEKIQVSKPLLRDVIVAVEDHIKSFTQYEVDYNIEIKSLPMGDNKFHPLPEEFSDLVYNLINQYLPLERVVIQSFDFRVLQYWNKKYPKVRLAALVENQLPASENIKALGFIPSIYSPDFKLLSKEIVAELKRKKIRVIPWTVNNAEDMLRMKSWGVDGIITDYPNRAAQAGMGLKRNGNSKSLSAAGRK